VTEGLARACAAALLSLSWLAGCGGTAQTDPVAAIHAYFVSHPRGHFSFTCVSHLDGRRATSFGEMTYLIPDRIRLDYSDGARVVRTRDEVSRLGSRAHSPPRFLTSRVRERVASPLLLVVSGDFAGDGHVVRELRPEELPGPPWVAGLEATPREARPWSSIRAHWGGGDAGGPVLRVDIVREDGNDETYEMREAPTARRISEDFFDFVPPEGAIPYE
jgi:outer membrane lipoprotein-sorting protein